MDKFVELALVCAGKSCYTQLVNVIKWRFLAETGMEIRKSCVGVQPAAAREPAF
jgi:hypothetical protein